MKKTSRAALLFILSVSGIAIFGAASALAEPARSAQKTPTARTTDTRLTNYDTDKVKFLYTTGRYMEAAVACKRILTAVGNEDFPRRNQVVLIKWLSDLRLGYMDLNFDFRSASFAELPELSEVFDILYRRGEYETLVKLSEGVEGPLARYFQGLALYATGNFSEAEEKLLNISSSFELYPHAELILSQIMLTREDTNSALEHLNLAKEAAEKKTDRSLIDQIELKKGYILFNLGDYEAAESSFAKVSRSGKLRGSAISAKAWSQVKQGNCKGTINAIDKLKPLSQFSKDSQELMILESYCQDNLGDNTTALTSLTHAIDLFQALEASYATVYIGGHLPLGIIELLDPEDIADIADEGKRAPYRIEYGETAYPTTDGDHATDSNASEYAGSGSPSTQALFFLQGLKSTATSDDSNVLALAEDNYRALKIISSLYRKKENEIEMIASSLGRKIKAKKKGIVFVKEHSLTIQEQLKKLSSIIYSKEGSLKGLSFTPSKTKTEIITRWEKHLNRPVTTLEERVIDMVMLDGEDGVWYLNNTQYCQFLYWMAIDPTKAVNVTNNPFEGELGVIEKVVRDLKTASTGAKTPYEILIPKLEPLVKEKNREDEERLKALIILRNRIRKNRILAEAATEKVRLEIEETLVRRAGLMRFDIRSILEKAFTLLRDIERRGIK